MRGEVDSTHNYYYNGSALPINKNSVLLYKRICSSLLPNNYYDGFPIHTCCSEGQLETFQRVMGILNTVVPNCGICRENIQLLTCHAICSEYQDQFSEVHISEMNPKMVDSIIFFIPFEFVEIIYNSCKDVKFPNSMVSITTFMCTVGQGECNAEKFIHSLLTYSTFNITAKIIKSPVLNNKNFNDLFPRTLKCNEPFQAYDYFLKPLQSQPIMELDNSDFENKIQFKMRLFLEKWGILVSTNKILYSCIPIIILLVFSCGIIYRFEISSDPIEIWSPPNGKLRKHKEFFDQYFGPSFRIEQILIKTPKLIYKSYNIMNKNVIFGSPFEQNILEDIFQLQKGIESLVTIYRAEENGPDLNVTLSDVCHKALEPANVLVLTYIVNNNGISRLNAAVEAWEKMLLLYLKDYSHPYIEISYSSERSIKDEIDRQTHAEFLTVCISYLLMFLYVSVMLGKINTKSLKGFFVQQKFILGFIGVLLVLSSVIASIGFYCYLGFKVNMIVLEVLPFLALAIGVDNIFLMVHEFEKIKSESNNTNSISNMNLRPNILCCIKLSNVQLTTTNQNILEKIFEILSRIIFKKWVKPFILFIFITAWFICFYFIPSIKIGLDQTSALPMDSYLLKYYEDAFNYLKSGPPVYFMVYPGFRYEEKHYQNLICSNQNCNPNSLTSTIYHYSRISKNSRIATAADSWLDAYLAWLKPNEQTTCCRYKIDPYSNETIFCPSYLTEFDEDCMPCYKSINYDFSPTPEEFLTYLPWFLSDIPVEMCPLGGKPSFGSIVILNPNYYKLKNLNEPPILASAFMTFHTSLGSSEELITALDNSIKISENISTTITHTVVPYSGFYIYYESYFTIWRETAISFGASFLAVLIANFFLYGFNIRMTILMTFLTFIMNSVNAGFMYLLNISLNPVSLVNLIMFVGINVEFLSHIGRAYLVVNSTSRSIKAKYALVHT
ncbi:hypothetical protein HZS_4123, partial [Henneguya salminicola]